MHFIPFFYLILLILLTGGCEKDPIIARQVKAIATVTNDNYLIEVDKHISASKRPLETFNFPIKLGEVGPIDSLYSGARQYPFYCMTLDAGLGQPLVDNHKGEGVAVYDNHNKIIGYSKDCLIPSRLEYYYKKADNNQINRYDLKQPPKLKDIALTTINGKQVPEIYRLERGTINRFVYNIVMIVPMESLGDRYAKDYWNQKLIYQFKGGASIGFRQGRIRPKRLINRRKDLLSQGYAVIASSGNHTGYGYNILLSEDTARRVKKQFTSLYGDPLYTLGIGGSGGALTQYLIAQNSTDILDGIMPLYSYPDMVSQSIYLLDCDLLHHYFNITNRNNKRWRDWEQRQLIEGLNGINGYPYPYALLQPINQILAGSLPSMPKGSSECVRSWFIAATFFYNPNQGFIKPYFSERVKQQVKWTYWQDLVQIYGTDKKGFARTTWSNEGVQYGLEALKQGAISIEEFIHLNQYIGSWVDQDKMKHENALKIPGFKYAIWLSMWSRNNIVKAQNGIAKRKAADAEAIRNGYRYGQIFVGKAELPILELRHYLEHKLDMHHASASFETRMRINNYQGHSDNHIIWIADKKHTPILEAVNFLDQWILARKLRDDNDPVQSKPKTLKDSCFNSLGETIYEGDNVWDGAWNGKTNGKCSEVFPIYSNSRIQAGGPWAGSVFQCGLMSIEEAINNNLYGDVKILPYIDQLKSIFPQGVCDYRQGDIAKPDLGLTPTLKTKD